MLRIWQIMEEEGRRYDWLARKSGYTPAHISKVKNGGLRPSRHFKHVMSLTLGLPVEEIFREVPDGTESEQVA